MEDVVIIIAIFSAIVIPIYTRIRSRHLERMALIEKGLVTEDVKYLYPASSELRPYGYLKWGLILIFAGIGISLPLLFELFLDVEPPYGIGLIPISVGIALLIFYRFALKKQKEGEIV